MSGSGYNINTVTANNKISTSFPRRLTENLIPDGSSQHEFIEMNMPIAEEFQNSDTQQHSSLIYNRGGARMMDKVES